MKSLRTSLRDDFLPLMIHSGSFDRNAERTRWSDAKVQKLEGRIAEFVAGLMRTAVALRRKVEQSKREEAERQRRAQELARLSKDVQEEEKKLEQFNKWVDEWNRAELLRRFIAVYAEKSQSWNSDKLRLSTKLGSNGRHSKLIGSIHSSQRGPPLF